MDAAGYVDDIMKRIAWMIEEKEGFLDAFFSTLTNFPFSGLSDEFAKIPSKDFPILLLWVRISD